MKSLKNSVEISCLWVIGYGKLYIMHCELYIVHYFIVQCSFTITL